MSAASSLVVAVLAVALLGCSFGADDPEVPSDLADCNHGPSTSADDLVFPSALHWLEADHGYDEPGEIFVCIEPEIGGTVTMTGPEGVDVSPSEQRVDPAGNGVLRFEVRVAPGASGEIEARTSSEAGGSTLSGPVVDAADDDWAFREAD